MANLGDGRQWLIRAEFVPASDWSQDANANYLFLHLPGFKKEELRLELASTGHVIISGERIVNDNKSIYFHQSFALPENANMDKISGKFDGDFLHVTVPRRSAVEENKQQQIRNENHGNGIGDTSLNEETNRHGENPSKHEEQHGNHAQHQGEMISNETYRVASFPKETIKNREKEDGSIEMANKFLKKNKGVVLSVVIAFSIVVLVCPTFQSSGE
ncbi:hypothetical protein PTKIN_Ptkin05aG0166500 [Pterospermum kingtungense]